MYAVQALTNMPYCSKINIEKGTAAQRLPLIHARNSPSAVWSARRGFLIYRLTDKTKMVNTTRNVKNS